MRCAVFWLIASWSEALFGERTLRSKATTAAWRGEPIEALQRIPSASGSRSGSAKEVQTACERQKGEATLRVGETTRRQARSAGDLRGVLAVRPEHSFRLRGWNDGLARGGT